MNTSLVEFDPKMAGILYALKMLLRKEGTFSAILSITLLVAVIASTCSVANNLSLQVQALSRLVNPGGTVIIIGANASSLTDSSISLDYVYEVNAKIRNLTLVRSTFTQGILRVSVDGNATAYMRFIDDVAGFLRWRNARLNGTIASSDFEVNVGEVLAKLLSINVGENVTVQCHGKQLSLKVSGVFRSQTEVDAEIVAQIKLLEEITGSSNVTLIEVALSDKSKLQEALSQIKAILPQNLRAIQTQQLLEFAEQTTQQTIKFLDVWFTAVYIAIAVASYVAAGRLIAESSYELAMLKTLGASSHLLSITVILYTAIVASAGSLLGAAVGVTGAQVAATIFRWIKPSIVIEPFLEPQQLIPITLLTLAFSLAGCIYPAFKKQI
ncbi:MAG: ABC transporter permease [Candidatus Bathyarchaeia archaeon]